MDEQEEQKDAPAGADASGRTIDVNQMVAQLQQMIEQVATAATPALREVAAKAAELASSAATHAGPIAHKVAAKTDQVGQVVAEKSARFATDLRHAKAGDESAAGGNGGAGDGGVAPPHVDPDAAATIPEEEASV